MNEDENRDEIADFADRMDAKRRRGEDEEFEFAIEWGSLTEGERDEFMALMDQRIARGQEVLETLDEENRALKALLLAPEVILRPVENWPEPGPYVGREAVMRWAVQLRDAWDVDAREVTSEFIQAADRVIVTFTWRGVGHGPPLNMEFTGVFTVHKGKIRFVQFFWDRAEALEAAGLEE